MTRLNSVEIGGRDSRTTSSMACRNDEPARSALAMSVIVSGSCLLKAFRRPPLRRLSQKRGSRNPINAPTSNAIGDPRAGMKKLKMNISDRDADDRSEPDEQVLGRLEAQVGARELAGEVRPEVPPLDDLVQVGERLALGDQVADRALAGAGRLAGLGTT